MSGLLVEKPGILSLIEDAGRIGYGDIGVCQSGTADRYSAVWANRLLFNDPDSAVLEMLIGNVSLISQVDTAIALTGAESTLKINGQERSRWRSHRIKKGDRIDISAAKKGLRSYLSVAGGFGTQEMLGSRSVTPKDKLGDRIAEGDLLPCSSCTDHIPSAVPQRYIPDFLDVLTLRVAAGYQYDEFSSDAIELFFDSPYEVTTATDRMGCRLQGEAVRFDGEIISEPISYGAVQIPSDGQPIVLLNERQTIGGYPKIGSVIPMDCYRLAQARPGTTVAFQEIPVVEAAKITKDLYMFMQNRTIC